MLTCVISMTHNDAGREFRKAIIAGHAVNMTLSRSAPARDATVSHVIQHCFVNCSRVTSPITAAAVEEGLRVAFGADPRRGTVRTNEPLSHRHFIHLEKSDGGATLLALPSHGESVQGTHQSMTHQYDSSVYESSV